MTVTVELRPSMEQRAAAAAAYQGLDVPTYLSKVLERVIPISSPPPLTLEEFDQLLDELSEGSEDWPVLPPEADSREWIYRDHD